MNPPLNDLISAILDVEVSAWKWTRERMESNPLSRDIDPRVAYQAGAKATGEPLAAALREAIETLESIYALEVHPSDAGISLGHIHALLSSAKESK